MVFGGDEADGVEEGAEAKRQKQGEGDGNVALEIGGGGVVGLPDQLPEAPVPIGAEEHHDGDRPVPCKLQALRFAKLDSREGGEHEGDTKAGGRDNDAPEKFILKEGRGAYCHMLKVLTTNVPDVSC